jgi:hypothetical protein
VHLVHCDEAQLQQLAGELDALLWSHPEGARAYFESAPETVPSSGFWLHQELESREEAIRNVLLGKQTSIHS